jgi:hypothetical protein
VFDLAFKKVYFFALGFEFGRNILVLADGDIL